MTCLRTFWRQLNPSLSLRSKNGNSFSANQNSVPVSLSAVWTPPKRRRAKQILLSLVVQIRETTESCRILFSSQPNMPLHLAFVAGQRLLPWICPTNVHFPVSNSQSRVLGPDICLFWNSFATNRCSCVQCVCMLAKTIIEVDEIDRFSLFLCFFSLSEFCSGSSENSWMPENICIMRFDIDMGCRKWKLVREYFFHFEFSSSKVQD